MAEALLWPVGLGLLGLVFGSFAATLAVRWPEGRSATRGRSRCDACDAKLRPRELVPVLSYVVQRGRCRRCGAAIAPSHPLTELTGLAIGVAAGCAAPGWEGAAGAAFGWLLLVLAAVDLAAFWLPDALTLALAAAGLGTGLAGVGPPMVDRVIGGVAGWSILALVAALYRLVRGRIGLGGGDPKLMGAIGLWLGWKSLPAVLFVACAIGIAAVLLLRARGRRMGMADRVPFGAPLAAAAFLAWLAAAGRG